MSPSRMEKKQNHPVEKQKKPRRVLKILVLSIAALLLIAGGAFAYVAYQVNNVASDAQVELQRGEQSEYREAAVKPDIDPVSILFLGLDTRDGDLDGRTDAMVLATFNPDEGSIKMMNIPRDTRVSIPGRLEPDKINHAHAYGGVDLTLDTVEEFLNVPVDYFVSLNFDAFMEIIDEVGGVEIDSPMAFSETDNATYGTIHIREGEQRLDGEEALAYVRMRKDDPQGDLGRGERQKEVMESLVNELASFNSITNFNSLLNALGRNLNTNVAFSHMVDMHAYASELDNIESITYEGEGEMIGGVYFYQPDEFSLEQSSQRLQAHLGLIEEVDSMYAGEEMPEDYDPEENITPSSEPNLEWNDSGAENINEADEMNGSNETNETISDPNEANEPDEVNPGGTEETNESIPQEAPEEEQENYFNFND